jgi:hypothetical protein
VRPVQPDVRDVVIGDFVLDHIGFERLSHTASSLLN